MIAETSLTECIASLCQMVRENPPRLIGVQRDRLITLFQHHVRQQYLIIQVDRPIFWRAATLCRMHPLRAYDALQLACAMMRREDDRAAGRTDTHFVCADNLLLQIAGTEGFMVENPINHP